MNKPEAETTGPKPESVAMLRALNLNIRQGKLVLFGGSPDSPEKIAKRRAKNKVARQQRRTNRKRG